MVLAWDHARSGQETVCPQRCTCSPLMIVFGHPGATPYLLSQRKFMERPSTDLSPGVLPLSMPASRTQKMRNSFNSKEQVTFLKEVEPKD